MLDTRFEEEGERGKEEETRKSWEVDADAGEARGRWKKIQKRGVEQFQLIHSCAARLWKALLCIIRAVDEDVYFHEITFQCLEM